MPFITQPRFLVQSRCQSTGPAPASTSGSLKRAPRKVLLTNDDGPESPFFAPWVAHVREVLGWDAVVGLPAGAQSFVSKSISRGPIKVGLGFRDAVKAILGFRDAVM